VAISPRPFRCLLRGDCFCFPPAKAS
jgi:hypothetical protein